MLEKDIFSFKCMRDKVSAWLWVYECCKKIVRSLWIWMSQRCQFHFSNERVISQSTPCAMNVLLIPVTRRNSDGAWLGWVMHMREQVSVWLWEYACGKKIGSFGFEVEWVHMCMCVVLIPITRRNSDRAWLFTIIRRAWVIMSNKTKKQIHHFSYH